ncbi:MAG: nucleotidyltransferase family protein [Ignavibacteriae bacterium]|nr:nucleotidyltransferase family protein [Ignavibacteriota bacterium]
MLNIQEYINKIHNYKSELISNYGLSEIAFFGSYTKHNNNENSDLDILVEFERQPSLLKFVNLKNFLTDLLGIEVDLVMKSALKPALKNEIIDSSIKV